MLKKNKYSFLTYCNVAYYYYVIITSSNFAQLMTTITTSPSFENYNLPLHGDMQISVIEVVVFEISVIKIDARHMELATYI